MKSTIIKQCLSVFLKLIVPLLTTSINERQAFAKGLTYYVDRLSNLETTQGLETMIKTSKACRNIVLQYLGGNPIFIVSERISIDKSGLPSILGPLKVLVKEAKIRPRIAAGILTILYLTKVIKAPVKGDFDPIRKVYTGGDIANIRPELEKVMTVFKLKHLKIPSWNSCHLSIRKGPSNKPAMMSSIPEIGTIKKDQIFLDDLLLLGGKKFNTYISPILERVKDTYDVKLSRLSVIPDKEGKSRIIGLVDYWTQTVLLPFHDHTMSILKQFSQDATWDQAKFTKRPIPDGPYYSFDLSNATDRFPVALQEIVLEIMYNQKIAAAWRRLLTRREFDSKEGPVVFATGQPLGAYSSWSVFSLSHHLIVQIAALRANRDIPFDKYYLLGDDIMIADSSTALEYRKLMDYLGVEVSKTKTIISDSLFVFASRYFINKIEVSPFTFTGLHESIRNPSNLTSFIQTMAAHGWQELLSSALTPGTVERLVGIFSDKPQTRFSENVRFFLRFPLNGILAVLEVSNEILTAKYSLSCFDEHNPKLLKDYVLLTMRENLIKSLPALNITFQKWKDMFPPLVEYFIPEPEFEPFKFPLRHDTAPWANTWSAQHKHVLNMLITLKDLFRGETNDIPISGWIPAFRTLCVLPKPEAAFKDRNHVIIVMANASILKDAYRNARRKTLVELYDQVRNPFDEGDESS